MTMSGIVPDASISKLREDQKAPLRRWRSHVLKGESKVGLWVVGPRGSGSSYIANVAMRRITRDLPEWGFEWQQAQALMDATRNRWTADEQVRQHPDDYGLFQEGETIQTELDFFWKESKLACVDDLHSVLDIKFWRKHCQEASEQRIKAGLPTIVATDMAPSDPAFSDVTLVIENLFVVCDATR